MPDCCRRAHAVPRRPPIRAFPTRTRTRPSSTDSTWSSALCRTGSPSTWCPSSAPGWAASSTWRPTSGCGPRPVSAVVRRGPRRARAPADGGLRPARALPRRPPRRDAGRRGRLLPDVGRTGARAAVRRGLVEPTGIIVDAASPVCRAPVAAPRSPPLRDRGRGLHCVRAVDPSPHAGDRADPRRARSSSPRTWRRWSAASLPRVTPVPPPRRPSGRGSWRSLHDAYDAEPFVVVTDDPRRPKPPSGSNFAHVDCPCRPAHRMGRCICARSTTWSRAPRARPSSVPTPLSGCPRRRGCRSQGSTRERHRAQGLRRP